MFCDWKEVDLCKERFIYVDSALSRCSSEKVGIKCLGRISLVAHGRRPSKPHFHGPIRRRISKRRQKKRVKIFINFTYLHKTQPGQKPAGDFPNFLEDISSPDIWASRFGCRLKYLTVSWRYSDSNRRNPQNLFDACLRHFKSGDKAS